MDNLIKKQKERHIEILIQLKETENQMEQTKADTEKLRERMDLRLLKMFPAKGLYELLFKMGINFDS